MSFITSLGDWLRKITRSFASASISGQNITLTRHNGDTVVLTTQDTVNNAFTKIKLGTVTLEPDSINDTLTLGVGAGIQLSANATNDSITVSGVEATQSLAGIMSTADKIKLDGISANAEVNQNAFAIVKVGATNITADVKQDTLNLIEGNNITLSPNATSDSITISATDTTYNDATQSVAGLMSTTDKTKLDNLPAWSLADSAGRASGAVVYNSILAMRGVDSTTVLTLAAGENANSSKGAKLYLYGTGTDTNQGDFVIQAGSSGGTYKQLVGKSDGTLTWDGVNIVQNTFSNVKVGNTTIVADDKADTLELVAGTGITLTPDATDDKVTIEVTSGTYADAAHTHAYLPLSGGTMTGAIISNSATFARRGTNAEQLILLGGSGANSALGAKLYLNGADYSNSGYFMLQAGNTSGYKQLIGKPNGALTWDGYKLAPLPISGTGVGHFESVSQSSGVYSLPSGGTWGYFLIASNTIDSVAGIAAGGTQIYNNSNVQRIDGFIWRIA